ncbi:peptidase domain-containing ABC transporter [Victivallis vadensis]|uniref:peptidase domain-containing ABC transporter n=1 Tax=Victivallis vadensis TaxID=172901 RepID=UPI003D00CA3D
MEPVNVTGIACLRYLSANLKRDINFDALITPELQKEFAADQSSGLMKLAAALQLSPEQHKNAADLAETYAGPALLLLQSGSWVCAVNLQQLKGPGVTLFDPLAQGKGGMLNVPTEQLRPRLGDAVIIFRTLQAVDNRKHSGLFALTAIGRHHNVPMDIRRLLHDYAAGEQEVSVPQLLEIAGDYQLKAKKVRLRWKDFAGMGQAFPLIDLKKDGTRRVICGMRRREEGDDLAVVDPAWQAEHPGQQFNFMAQKEFEETSSGSGILLKRVYKLADEDQPFGLRWFIPEFLKLKGIFGQIALAVLMINAIALITPLFFQIVVDKVLVNNSYNTLNVLGIGIVAAILFNAMLEYLRNYLLLFATNKIDIATATKTFKHLMRLPIEFFERVPSGVLLKHMQQTEKIRGFLSGNLFFTVLELFSLVVFIPFLLLYSVELTLVVLGYSVLMALVIATLIKPFQIRLNELYQAEGKRQSMLVESIHGIRTVKSLAIEPVEEKAWNDSTAYAIKSYFRVGKISMTARTISQMLEMLMTVSVIWLGASLVFDHVLSIGALIAFQMLSGRVTGPLVRLVGLIHEYQQVALSVRMLGVVMNTPVEPAGGGVRNPLKGNISFENVTFQYRPDTPQVIRNLDLDVPVGSTIGIVGRSGSGKTTLTKLLQGLYPVQSGLIKIDGIDLREIDKSHLRSSIGVVLQENYFFNGTVRENICLTKRNATLEEIIYAARLAGAHDFVQTLPKGYDTMLEENASNLSGGQKQRLAIARALLTNPSILIFDEATSALDPESENVIQENLGAIAKGRTVLIISHRLSIVSGADKILVLDKGVRTDFAPHRELLSHDGIYRDFWRQQMERNLAR